MLAGVNSAATVWSPGVVKVCSTVEMPFVTVAVWVCSPMVNSTVPAASAGVTVAVRVVGSSTRIGPVSTVTSVVVASASTVTVLLSVLLV